jgi:predicted RNA-binding protein with PIN domain
VAGHASITTTSIYLASDADRQQEVVALGAAAWSSTRTAAASAEDVETRLNTSSSRQYHQSRPQPARRSPTVRIRR